jgi:reactive intermediate/imine deaminase
MSHDPESVTRRSISTAEAPAAIGPYSQAVTVGNLVFLSGQIPLDPETMTLVPGDVGDQARQVFSNLEAVARAAGGSLDNMVKLTVYLRNLADFQAVNSVMEEFFTPPFPARAALGVADLPRSADVEVEGIMSLPQTGSSAGGPGGETVKGSTTSGAE